jgi:hypothetical protein
MPNEKQVIRRIHNIVCFGIPEPRIDDLIDATRGTPYAHLRWIVFGSNMSRLGGLCAQWEGSVDLVIVLLTDAVADFHDAALLILENENVSVDESVWLQSEDPNCPLPEFACALRVGASLAPEDFPKLLRQLSGAE